MISLGARGFCLFQNVQTGSGTPRLLFDGYWSPFSGVKRPEGDVDH